MCQPAPSSPGSAAGKLLTELALYEAGLERLAAEWDAALFTELAGRFETMRSLASLLPHLSVDWVQVLITRFELADALWRSRFAPGSVAVLSLLRAHRDAIDALRARCKRHSACM